MNFKRIQWIFFFAFLLFDVIIASSLLVENRFIVTNNQGSRSSLILKEMKDDSINFGKLSRSNGKDIIFLAIVLLGMVNWIVPLHDSVIRKLTFQTIP